MAEKPSADDKEADRRFDQTVGRLVNTPHTPQHRGERTAEAAALALRFLLELALLAALATWGVRLPLAAPLKALAAIAAPAGVATIWGAFLAPRRRIELGPLARLALEAVLFGLAGLALAAAGAAGLGALLAGAALLDRAALAWFAQRRTDPSSSGV